MNYTPTPSTGMGAYVQNFAREKGIKPCEAIARIAGFGCYEQFRQAKTVVDHGTPELREAMDAGKIAIHNAAIIARYPDAIQREIVGMERKTIILMVKELKRETASQAPMEASEGGDRP